MTSTTFKPVSTIWAELEALLDSKGARLIKFAFTSNRETTAVIYAKWRGEYVTWLYHVEEPAFYWGHYHSDNEDKAIADFHERAKTA